MGGGKAIGFIESLGLASAITAADAALKAANVELVGRENSRGSGLITIKITGDVGAVNAAIGAAKAASSQVSRVWATDVIPRPGEGQGPAMVWNADTQGAKEWLGQGEPAAPANLPAIRGKAALANRPDHYIVPVPTDIPKPAIITPAGKAGAKPGSSPAPRKSQPRRRGKKP
jgi:hypothetical protein